MVYNISMNKYIEKFDVENFCTVYRGTREFVLTKYFTKFFELLGNEELLDKIKFANDTFEIPPVKTMLAVYRDFFNEQMSAKDKQGLGACFGYLYRFIYNEGYEAVQAWVGDVKDGQTGIKTASFFTKR